MTWGIESNVINRFGTASILKEKISFHKKLVTFKFPGSPSEFVDGLQDYYGPTMNAFDAAEKNHRAADLQAELEALFTNQNQEPPQRRHLDSGDVSARDRVGVKRRCPDCPRRARLREGADIYPVRTGSSSVCVHNSSR